MEVFLKLGLEQLVGQYPIVVSIILVMGSLRVIMKPLMSLLQAIAKETSTPKDNELLAKLLDNKIYKALSFCLDFVASVKLPKKK